MSSGGVESWAVVGSLGIVAADGDCAGDPVQPLLSKDSPIQSRVDARDCGLMVIPSAAESDGGVVMDWSCDAVTRGRCCCCGLTVNSQQSWNGSWCGSVAATVADGGNDSRAMGVSLASVMTVPLLTWVVGMWQWDSPKIVQI